MVKQIQAEEVVSLLVQVLQAVELLLMELVQLTMALVCPP
jgi:hypothetical protein